MKRFLKAIVGIMVFFSSVGDPYIPCLAKRIDYYFN